MPTVKKAQHSKNNHSLKSFKLVISSGRLKLASAALGEFVGSRACMKAFSLSDSHLDVEGTTR